MEKGIELRAILVQNAYENEGSGKHWTLREPVKVKIFTSSRNGDAIEDLVAVALWKNAIEFMGDRFKPYWAILNYEL